MDPEVDSTGFRNGVTRWLKNLDPKAFPKGTVLDPFAPQTPRIRPVPCKGVPQAKDLYQRSLEACAQGVPVARLLAWAESTTGQVVLFYEQIPHSRTLYEALLFHYYEQPLCSELMQLLQVVADAVRCLHQSGWKHGALELSAVLVTGETPGQWERAVFRNLRGGSHPGEGPLPARERGLDVAGIELPSDLRRIFNEMQYAPEHVPKAFFEGLDAARSQAHSHRLPLDHLDRPLPSEKDIWIWDDRSMQAIPSLRSRDKRKYYRKRDLGPMAGAALKYGPRLRREKRKILEEAWSGPVELEGTLGISLNLEPDRFEQERRWLEPLGAMPLLVRLYHHETEANQRFAVDAVRRLQAEGHLVTVALVQDRCAVTQPTSWQRFVERTAGALSGFVEGFEVGHAINRVKWGFWDVPEYKAFLEPFLNWKDRFPQIPLMGPAGIDFEFPRILPMLNQWPAGSLSAYSHHLYVDRRGAPENTQSGYDLEAKLAYARAIARIHPACEERVVVSEVNWPLSGTGVWSPVGSPYESPGERTGDPSVDEETYAAYMRRYILIALCSGLADRVYWWNLVAHGFGLVDDRHAEGWRPRPAYHAFKELVDLFRGSRFEKRTSTPEGWVYDLTRGEETLQCTTTLDGVDPS